MPGDSDRGVCVVSIPTEDEWERAKNNITKRKEILDLFKAFYICRSKATHEGRFEKKIKVPNYGKMEVEKLLEQTDGLCIEAIKKILDFGGFPDWDALMLGAEIEET